MSATNAIHTSSIASSPISNPLPAPADKINRVSRSIFRDLLTGLKNSRVLRIAVFTTAIVLSALYLASNPLGWASAIVIIGIAAVALRSVKLLASSKERQKIAFELGIFKRALTQNKYDEIPLPVSRISQGKIFLSALPNQLTGWEEIIHKEKIRHVVSLNEPWEREPLGLSVPFTAADWQEIGVTVHNHDLEDHTSFQPEKWFSIANEILGFLDKGENVDVHCKAGQGRSAIAVALTHILQTIREAKKQGKILVKETVIQKIIETIKTHRPSSTIANKKATLEAFYDYADAQTQVQLPPQMPFFGLGNIVLGPNPMENSPLNLGNLLNLDSWLEKAQSLILELQKNKTLYFDAQNDEELVKRDYMIAVMCITHLINHQEANLSSLRTDQSNIVSIVVEKIKKYALQSSIKDRSADLDTFYKHALGKIIAPNS